MTRKHVVVIGAGASGVAAAAALVRRKHAPRVTLVERAQFGPGLAYATKDKSHLLNVRASNMSALADKPSDFADWLRSKTGADASAFASRGRYGRYIETVLRRSQRRAAFGGGLQRVRGDAIACRAGSGWWHVTLASGRTLEANGVVFALGNQPLAAPSAFANTGVAALDPWDADKLKRIGAGDVLLLARV